MNQLDAKLLVVLLISLAISAGAAWWLAGRYRKALLRHMTAAAPDPAAPPAHERSSSASAPTQHVPFNLQRNRRHNRRLAIVIISISALIGATTGAFELLVVHTTAGFGWQRWLLLSLTYAWPLVPALGLLWRWPIGRTVAGIVAYLLCLTPLILVGSNVEQTLTLVTGWLASTTVLPLLTLLGLTASARIRAIAPLLFPPVLVMSALSMLGVEWLALAIEAPPATLVALVETLGAMPTLLLAVAVPWAVGIWPALGMLRLTARAYRRKRFSDLSYLFAIFWLAVLIGMALPSTHSAAGMWAFAIVLAWLWIPLGFLAARRWLRPPAPAATMLVLRVFNRDAEVANLFDAVTERWRATGNTLLIAGTDVITHTLDADDLFVFLSRRLGERFITAEADVSRHIGDLDLAPDHDGRYRINECYCSDATWQPALQALLARSDAVLMDLRDFSADNQGCRFELAALAKAGHVARIVILTNDATDRTTAEADLGVAAARVSWLDVDTSSARNGRRILSALAGAH